MVWEFIIDNWLYTIIGAIRSGVVSFIHTKVYQDHYRFVSYQRWCVSEITKGAKMCYVLIELSRQDILGFNIGCTIGQDILYFTICGLIATERYYSLISVLLD